MKKKSFSGRLNLFLSVKIDSENWIYFIFDTLQSKDLTRYSKIHLWGMFKYKNLFNFICTTMKFHNYHQTTSEASKTSSTKKKRKRTAEWTWNTFRIIVIILIFVNARMSNPTALFVSFEQISYAFSSIAPTFAQFFGSGQYPFDIDAPEMIFIGRNSIY